MSSQPETCPFCTKPFEEGDITAGYRIWPSVLPRSAHFRCLISHPDKAQLPKSNTEGGAAAGQGW
jgi:hypothetical protein